VTIIEEAMRQTPRNLNAAPPGARWKFPALVAGLVLAIGAALFPVAIYPMYNSEPYKKSQAVGRAGIVQEEVQPGGMKVWSDPFGRK